MSIPNFSVKNSVLVNMLMLVILIGGGMFALTLTKEMFPESRPNKLLISAVDPGVQPEEIEKSMPGLGGEGAGIVTERNKTAVSVPADTNAQGKKKVSGLYGAAHQPELAKSL